MVKKNENIKVIFFDIGGVLLHIHPDKMISHISDITGLSYEKVRLSFPEKGHDIYEKGQMNNQEWFQTFKSALPHNSGLMETEFWDAWAMILGEESKVIDILLFSLSNKFETKLTSSCNIPVFPECRPWLSLGPGPRPTLVWERRSQKTSVGPHPI